MDQISKLELPIELENYRELIENSIKPYIKITTKKENTLPWDSKFGGIPYLPIGCIYPKDKSSKPMRLLAQINFEQVTNIEFFPKKGLLQFYISAEDDVYGLDFDNGTKQDNFKIIYIPEVIKDTSKLIDDFSFLDDLDIDYFPIQQENKLYFNTYYEPVSCEDYKFEKVFNESSYNFFESFGENEDEIQNYYMENYSGSGHKIGGYAYFTQCDPRDGTEYKDYEILLLQIDSDDDADIMWGDCGIANFFIRKEDLANLNFTSVLYNWDCY